MLRHWPTDFFQTWYDDRNHKVLRFNIRLDNLDLHSGSQLYERSRTSVSFFLANSSIELDEIQTVATCYRFAEARVQFILHGVLFKGENSAALIMFLLYV